MRNIFIAVYDQGMMHLALPWCRLASNGDTAADDNAGVDVNDTPDGEYDNLAAGIWSAVFR